MRKAMIRRAIVIVVVAGLIVALMAAVSPGFRLSLINTFKPGPGPININSIPGGRFPMPSSPPASLFRMSFTNVEQSGNSEWQAQVGKETGGPSSSFAGLYGLPGPSGNTIGGFVVEAAEPSTGEAALQSYILNGMIQNQDRNQSRFSTWSTWAPPPTPHGNTFRCSVNVQNAFPSGVGNCIWYNGFEVISVNAETTSLTALETLIESVVTELQS